MNIYVLHNSNSVLPRLLKSPFMNNLTHKNNNITNNKDKENAIKR